jgi:tetrapyrrole methylase family protein/MazG family protein
MSITIIGLGPGDGRYLTRQAWDVLSSAETVYLRTGRHPAVADLPPNVQQHTFDEIYETAEYFDEVYDRIVEELILLGWEAAESGQTVYYAVPGNPNVGEATVPALITAAREEGIETTIVPGISFIEPTLAAVGLDGLDGLQLFDALEIAAFLYPPLSPDTPLLIGQVYDILTAGELKLALMAVYPEEHEVVLIHGAGTAEEALERRPLYQIDFSRQIAHLTSLYVPPLPQAGSLAALAETVAFLRGPEGCPWDQEQTPLSVRNNFIEEVAEAIEAMESENAADICEELGDVLFHIVFQTQMAAEAGDFTLIRRHPHVWAPDDTGKISVSSSREVVLNWQQLKEKEKVDQDTPQSILDDIPAVLPALMQAHKIQTRVKQVGFDWADISGVIDKVAEELEELKAAKNSAEQADELGDLLFAVVNWARWLDIDAEIALRDANLRFENRFRELENLAAKRGQDLSALDIEALDLLWEEAKEVLWRRFSTQPPQSSPGHVS